MSKKSDNKATTAAPEVTAIPATTVPAIGKSSYAERYGSACVKADHGVQEAVGAVMRKEADALTTITAALIGCGPITTARWEAEFRVTVRNALEASGKYATKEAVKVALSNHYRTALAFSNGIAIETGETERKYLARVMDQLRALKDAAGNPVYAPANSGGAAKKPKAEKGTTLVTAKPMDKADAEAVLWLVNNAMPQLRELYAKLRPVEALDKAA